MHKCCWNCGNGFTAVSKTKKDTDMFNSKYRFCCASYPVSQNSVNPYKQRYCTQFCEPLRNVARMGHFIDKEEADKLNEMSRDELLKYWFGDKYD